MLKYKGYFGSVDYLEFCGERGRTPEKPLKGSFNVRIPHELHRSIAERAYDKGVTINKFIVSVLEKELTA